ncbi:acetate--CoA ligase family protein [Mesorhizobium sp. M1340]|uniref:acetate--CoA ligase family protein n=1 Tax=Mesorhizobium sp. M1340 TaxID=2957087 RepID=UPI00333C2046
MVFGYVHDADFGPLVMVSAGGTLVEYFADRQFALALFGEEKARSLIGRLSISRLLDGVRGQAPADVAVAALTAFSSMCVALSGNRGIDINSVLVSYSSAIAVDALIVPTPVPADEGRYHRQSHIKPLI